MAQPLRLDQHGQPVGDLKPSRIEVHADGSMIIFLDPRVYQVTTSGGHSNGNTVSLMTKVLITLRHPDESPPNARPTVQNLPAATTGEPE